MMTDLDRELVRTSLRSDIAGVVLGVLLTALGATAVTLYRWRKGSGDRALLWFGAFAGLYGLRLLCLTDLLPFIAMPVPRQFWAYAAACVTYSIPLPILLFVRQLLPEWRPWIHWQLWIQIVFALTGFAADQIQRRPQALQGINNVLVTILVTVAAVALFRRRVRGQRALQTGVAVFVCSLLLTNLSGLGLMRLPFNPEPIGFAILLGVLGRLTASRVFGNEERLRLLDQELEIARRIQSMILPRESPRTPGIRIATRYLPMTAVAGDFYDFLAVDGQRVGILVADVSGHGVPAALIASMVKIAIAGQLPHADDPPGVLAGINRALCGKFKGQFVTAAYLFVDLERGIMRYGSAGHPALLWSRGGIVEEIAENGMALGIRAKSSYMAVERAITSGDRFFLYTDGLIEARSPEGEQFGTARLAEMLAAGAELDIEGVASHALERLSAWTGPGRNQEDDLTLAVVDLVW